MPRTFGHFRSDQAHAQAQAQSAKSFLALWNRPKLVLQTLGKLAIRLQALDRKLNVPRTFGHFRSDQAHAQAHAQSAKSFLALWNRPKLVLQTLGKLAIRLQALDRKRNVPRTIGHFRLGAAQAQVEAEGGQSFMRTLLCFSDLSCVFQTSVMFFRPQLCFSDLSCVSESLVVFFRP